MRNDEGMMTVPVYTFGSILVVSLLSLTGILLLSFREDLFRRYIPLFISVAVGALLGDAFIHLIPEAFADAENTTMMVPMQYFLQNKE